MNQIHSIGGTPTRPVGWTQFTLAGDNNTFNTDILAASVADGTAVGASVVNNAPTGNENNGYNVQRPGGPVTNRALGTAPTTIVTSIRQFVLTNNTGASFNREHMERARRCGCCARFSSPTTTE